MRGSLHGQGCLIVCVMADRTTAVGSLWICYGSGHVHRAGDTANILPSAEGPSKHHTWPSGLSPTLVTLRLYVRLTVFVSVSITISLSLASLFYLYFPLTVSLLHYFSFHLYLSYSSMCSLFLTICFSLFLFFSLPSSYLFFSVIISLYISLFLSLPLYFCLIFSLTFSLSPLLSLLLSHPLSLSFSLSPPFSLLFSLSPPLFLSLITSLSFSPCLLFSPFSYISLICLASPLLPLSSPLSPSLLLYFFPFLFPSTLFSHGLSPKPLSGRKEP